MSNRTLFESTAAYTAREREAIVALTAFSMNQHNRISLNDIALVADVLRQLLLHETQVEPEIPTPLPPENSAA